LAAYESRFITPPSEEEVIYPYRRVWFSIIIEHTILFVVVLLMFIVTRFVSIPTRFHFPLGLAVALLPGLLWLFFSWRPERFAPQPRGKLLMVAVISGLTAKAIGLPVVNDIFQVERWLALQSAVNRIIGHTFTIGLVQAIITYIILRYLIWPDNLRTRFDSIAYGAASAVGYALVVNLDSVLAASPAPDIAAMNVFNTLALHLAVALIIAYGLSEVRFNNRPYILLLCVNVAVAALVTGVVIPLRTGLANAGISPLFTTSAVSPIRAFLFSGVVLAAVSVVVTFLIDIAQRRDSEKIVEEDLS
jgi:RsiW-degrading membrane proteinase PrsW (M82 family)